MNLKKWIFLKFVKSQDQLGQKQRKRLLMNRRESAKHCPNDDDEVQVLKESQTNRLKVLEGMKKNIS